jgi:hypothetical protein
MPVISHPARQSQQSSQSPRVLLCYAQPQNTWQLPSRKTDEIFFGYIACMGLSTGVSRQRYFKYFCQKYQKYITNVTPRAFAPVGAPRRPESPSDDIAAGRAPLR